MRKMKKFSDGGEVDIPDFSRLSFKEAFAAARGRGGKAMNKEFTWNGKRYTTELAETKSKAKAKDLGPDETSAETRRLRREEDAAGPKFESLPEKKKRSLELPKVEYTEEMNDAMMSALPGGSLLKPVREFAVKMASRAPKAAKVAEEFVKREPSIGKFTKEAAEEGSKREPTLGDVTKMAAEKGAKKEPKLGDISKKYPPSDDRIDPTFKKGGSVSSASRRADGCAMRGKTKGKIY